MQVPFSYLDRQFANCDDIFEDMKELVKTGKFTLGLPLKVFEEKFASTVGAKYAIGVGSGRAGRRSDHDCEYFCCNSGSH